MDNLGSMSAPSAEPLELSGLRVTIDRVIYERLTHEQSPNKPHSFIYYLSIHNDSDVTVTIRGRKWVVQHDDGTTLVVEGDGVVGEFPVIAPSEKFSYHSRHIIATRTAGVDGAYVGIDELQRLIWVRIPHFDLFVPTKAGER
jgi:ApaG protein